MAYRVIEEGVNGNKIEHGCYLVLRNAEKRAQQIRVNLTERLMKQAAQLTGIVRGKNAATYQRLVERVANLAENVKVEQIYFWDD